MYLFSGEGRESISEQLKTKIGYISYYYRGTFCKALVKTRPTSARLYHPSRNLSNWNLLMKQ